MEIVREFIAGNRYMFDMGNCTTKKGFAQVDTSQDAPYFGTWANPFTKQIVNYCEGDITITKCDSASEFCSEIRKIQAWNTEYGYKFLGIDPGFNSALQAEFENIGLGDLLH